MAGTGERTLRLLTLLQVQQDWTGADLADRLGVSARSLRRDVDRLRELGYPVRSVRGVAGGYRLAAGASLPPLALDDEEAVALAVGLHAATGSAVQGMAEPSLRALTKVVQVMPPRLRRRVEALRSSVVTASWAPERGGVEPAALLAAAQACRAGEGVTFDYTAAAGARTTRRVEPHRLVTLGRRWYLFAYDLDRGDWRSFRLDRIASLSTDGRRFAPRTLPTEDVAGYVQDGIGSAAWGFRVRVVLHCPVGTARERLGSWARLEPLGADRCEFTMNTESLAWAGHALGQAGAELSEVEPAELRELLADWSARFARASSKR